MNLLWLLLQESWFGLTMTILLSFMSGLCSARLISIINQAIHQTNLDQLFGDFLAIALLAVITGLISQFWLIHLSQAIIYKLRLRLSTSIIATPLKTLEELGSPRLLAVLISDIQRISDSIFLMPLLFVNAAIIIGCLLYLLFLSTTVFAMVFISALASVVMVALIMQWALQYFALARNEEDELYERFRSITEGIKELKMNAQRRQQFLEQELHTTADRSRSFKILALKILVMAFQGGQTAFFILLGLVIFALPEWLSTQGTVTSAYVLTITYLIFPTQTLIDKLPIVLEANVALQKIRKISLKFSNSSLTSLLKLEPIITSWHSLQLHHVIHFYQDPQQKLGFQLGPVSLSFEPGQIIFIVGGNGSGKSTLIKLISGLYSPEAGEIVFDQVPINEDNQEWYRQHFSIVFSDFHLFDYLLNQETINLDHQINFYLEKLQLRRDVSVQQGRLSSTKVSQGQRKRLSLLTAYLEDRPIYIFDEWASDQDPTFKAIFYENILPELKQKGKTIFVISHDDHYFSLADRLIKFNYGQLEYDSATMTETRKLES
ncbi:MAG: cyclic peptide export ABC transporter [Microcystaceae cyanobacterium]